MKTETEIYTNATQKALTHVYTYTYGNLEIFRLKIL